MSQNIRNTTSHIESRTNLVDRPQVSQLIAALEIKYATNAMALAMLSAIAIKTQKVPLSVQATVAELLRANLDSKIANTGLITAAIMAINPNKTIAEAANDENFLLAA